VDLVRIGFYFVKEVAYVLLQDKRLWCRSQTFIRDGTQRIKPCGQIVTVKCNRDFMMATLYLSICDAVDATLSVNQLNSVVTC
jgi:hypothetical protein